MSDHSRWKPSRVGLTVFVLAALFGLTVGLDGVVVFAGLYLLGTAVWTLLVGRSWLGPTGRRASFPVFLAGLSLLIAGSLVNPAQDEPQIVSSLDPTPSATVPMPTTPQPTTSSPSPSPSSEPSLQTTMVASPGSALAVAAELTVKGRAPKTGYDRDLFGSGWVDTNHNGCDTRNDILTRDLTGVTFKPGTRDCVVLSGTLADFYSGTTIGFVKGNDTSNDVQIDHVVALADAWQKGAQQWDGDIRITFANDPLNLLAVDGELNQQKGDGDTATWLPPNKAYRCAYVARQVAVKHTYSLWVTQAEQDAMIRILSTCPDQPLPDGTDPIPLAIAPATVVPTDPDSVYYPNCAAASAAGAAPLYRGEPSYREDMDGDGDGIACE